MSTPVDYRELFKPGARRWTPTRKLELMMAIRRGEISRDETMQRLAISADEMAAMESRLPLGVEGLSQNALVRTRRQERRQQLAA